VYVEHKVFASAGDGAVPVNSIPLFRQRRKRQEMSALKSKAFDSILKTELLAYQEKKI